MEQQTAVEWLANEIRAYLNFDQRLELDELLKQAKEMEKDLKDDALRAIGFIKNEDLSKLNNL